MNREVQALVVQNVYTAAGRMELYALTVAQEIAVACKLLRDADEMLLGVTFPGNGASPILELCFANGTARYEMHTFEPDQRMFRSSLLSWERWDVESPHG